MARHLCYTHRLAAITMSATGALLSFASAALLLLKLIASRQNNDAEWFTLSLKVMSGISAGVAVVAGFISVFGTVCILLKRAKYVKTYANLSIFLLAVQVIATGAYIAVFVLQNNALRKSCQNASTDVDVITQCRNAGAGSKRLLLIAVLVPIWFFIYGAYVNWVYASELTDTRTKKKHAKGQSLDEAMRPLTGSGPTFHRPSADERWDRFDDPPRYSDTHRDAVYVHGPGVSGHRRDASV